MSIEGATRIYAVIGDPITAVRSPEWFNALFARHGTNAVLIPLQVARDDLEPAFCGLKAMRNVDGVVVTMPHKGTMCGLLDSIGPAASLVGAVNAVRRQPDGRWFGDMFDGRGCVRGLRTHGYEVSGRRVFVLGVGAAGAAIAYAMVEAGVREVVIDDVDTARCTRVVEKLHADFPGAVVRRASVADCGVPDLAINATPLGMRQNDPLPFDAAQLPAATLIVDVITKPEVTPLLERARETGHRIHTGRHMYEGQAVDAARFFGFEP